MPRSVNITALRAGFGSKLAWIADREKPVILVGRDDADARHAADLAAAVGIMNLGGFLAGGFTSWREEQLPVARIPRMTVDELHEQQRPVQVLDVREQAEWDAGHIPGSVHTPYHDIDDGARGDRPRRPVAVICGSGQRSAVAAGLLELHGASQPVHVVDGGVGTWKKRRLAGRAGLVARAARPARSARPGGRRASRCSQPGDLLDHHDAARERLDRHDVAQACAGQRREAEEQQLHPRPLAASGRSRR